MDASALLAFLQGEPGTDDVEVALQDAAACGAANWSEVAQKVRSVDGDWDLARALLLSYDLEVVDVTLADAERAALAWQRGSGLSLADRLCLALGDRLDAEVWTADRAWGEDGRVRQVR
nr:PIN domain-containing protein [Salsipaludibacter albus]